MRALFIILLSMSLSLKAEIYPPKLVSDHLVRLLKFEGVELNPVQLKIRSTLESLDKKKKMTAPLLDYFSTHPHQFFNFYQLAIISERLSTIICEVVGEPRRVDDEVDGVRHIFFAGLLTWQMGKKTALDILSVLEKGNPDYKAVYMDLHNNQLAVNFIHDLGEVSYYQAVLKLQDFALNLLDEGELIINNSRPSKCQRY